METTLKKIYSLVLTGMFLLSCNFSHAQDSEKKENKSKDKKKNEMTCIIIYKDSDGKTIKIDTTVTNGFAFDFDDMKDFHFEMPELPELPDMADLPMPPNLPNAPGFFYHYYDNDKLSPEEKENLKKELEKVKDEMGKAREEMKKLHSDEFKKEMEELKEQMEKMKIEIYKEKEKYRDKNSDDKGDKRLMMYKMFKDDGNESGPLVRRCVLFSDGDTVITDCKIRSKVLNFDNDSTTGMKTIIFVPDDENKIKNREPKIEKKIVMIAKPGEPEAAVAGAVAEKEELAPQVKIEKLNAASNSNELQAEDLKFFPNPSDGNFSLSFRLNTTGATTVSLIDATGKEIFNETIENFTGEYNRQFDITGKAKGTYLLRIRQGDKWMHKKLVVK